MAASAAVMLLAAGSTIAAAQEPQSQESKNEVAVTIGRMFISDQTVPNTSFFDNTVHFGKGLSLRGRLCPAITALFLGRPRGGSPGYLQPGRRPELRYEAD